MRNWIQPAQQIINSAKLYRPYNRYDPSVLAFYIARRNSPSTQEIKLHQLKLLSVKSTPTVSDDTGLW